jgi:hypothetical protein
VGENEKVGGLAEFQKKILITKLLFLLHLLIKVFFFFGLMFISIKNIF